MTEKLTEELKEMPRMKGLAGVETWPLPQDVLFPELVDVVTEKDIYCDALSGNGTHTKHCLLGLSCVNFGLGEDGVDLNHYEPDRTEAQCYVNRELRESVRAFTGDREMDIIDFNDDVMGEDNKYWIARIWNATMARIGYTEGNPEAK